MPPFDYNSNPAIPGTLPSNQLQAPQQSGGWGGDYSSQLNDMLAPYKQQAEKMSSPYATMSPNSWLAKNHPGVAGMLDNAFLTIGSTPGPQGPEGVGGGISRMMQGLMGGQQFRRQQMMQNMMMPYQMLEPQLKAEDMLSLRDERRAASTRADIYNQSVLESERHHAMQEDMEGKRLEKQDRLKALAGPDKTDDKGQSWTRVFDPVTGKASLKHAVTGQDANELPKDQQPTFENEKKDARRGTVGGMMGEIIEAQMSKDPAIKARGQEMGRIYSSIYGLQAGARTGAESDITEPLKQRSTFINQEHQSKYSDIGPMDTEDKYVTAHDVFGQRDIDPAYAAKLKSDYAQYQQDYKTKITQRDKEFAEWQRSSAPDSGIGFRDYQDNKAKYTLSPTTSAPVTPASGTGATWVPKKK